MYFDLTDLVIKITIFRTFDGSRLKIHFRLEFNETVTVKPPLVVAPSRYTADDVTAVFMAAMRPEPKYPSRVRYRNFVIQKSSIGIQPGMAVNLCFVCYVMY